MKTSHTLISALLLIAMSSISHAAPYDRFDSHNSYQAHSPKIEKFLSSRTYHVSRHAFERKVMKSLIEHRLNELTQRYHLSPKQQMKVRRIMKSHYQNMTSFTRHENREIQSVLTRKQLRRDSENRYSHRG